MILKALRKKGLITISYYQNDLLQTCKGRINNLNLHEQILYLEDEQGNTFSIRLSGIIDIY